MDFSKTLSKAEKALIVYFRSLEKEEKEKLIEDVRNTVKEANNK